MGRVYRGREGAQAAKTTIELPEDVLIAARQRAAEDRTTLRALVERGLRAELRRRHPPARRAPAIRWVTVDGGLPRDLDVADRTALVTYLQRRP